MAIVTIEDTNLTNIANAIRNKNGTSTKYKPSEMASAISNIATGGVEPTGTLDITENGTYDVTDYASANVNVSTGGGSTGDGFIVEEYTADGYPLTVSISGISTINSGFLGTGKIVSYIENIKIKCSTFGARSFEYNGTVKKATIKDAQYIYMYAFNWAESLEYVDIDSQNIVTIAKGSFANSLLSTLIIRKTTPPTLENANAFENTPIANGTGYIYVPDGSINAYKTKANFSTYASQIKGISEL